MIETALRLGKENGFSTIEAFVKRIEKQELDTFLDQNVMSHQSNINRMTVRAFWEQGDPVGFNLSCPSLSSLKEAFSNIYSQDLPTQKENISTLLPGSAEKVKSQFHLFDETINDVGIKEFQRMIEQIREMLPMYPGLMLKRIQLARVLKKITLANTNHLNAKYKKTNFNLFLSFALKGNHIDINENKVFFQQIDLGKIITRADNLLRSLEADKAPPEKHNYLIMTPEASTKILKEFSSYLKIDGEKERKEVHFPSVLNIIDDPLLDQQTGSAPFDDEGIQSAENYIIKKGVYRNQISNIQEAFQRDQKSTGNGNRNDRSIFPSVRFSNLFIKPTVLTFKNLLKQAQQGILVSLIKLEHIKNDTYLFSAYGYRFEGEELKEPVHFHFNTTFLSYFLNIIKISKEIRYFYSTYNIGSPHLLLEAKHKSDNLFEI
jgi:PmbA protein